MLLQDLVSCMWECAEVELGKVRKNELLRLFFVFRFPFWMANKCAFTSHSAILILRAVYCIFTHVLQSPVLQSGLRWRLSAATAVTQA